MRIVLNDCKQIAFHVENTFTVSVSNNKEDKHKLWIAFTVSRSKLLHQPVDLLSFSWESESFEELSQGRNKLHSREVESVDVGVHDLLIEPVN